MLARALCGTLFGLDGVRIDVEADIGPGLPGFHIVGLADRALQEARERVKIAINNSGVEFPGQKVTVNLAPAQLPKEGCGFDLAIAVAILSASGKGQLPEGAAWLGELGLDGSVRRVRGVLPIAAHLTRNGATQFYVPRENIAEARLGTSHPVHGVRDLQELVAYWESGSGLAADVPAPGGPVAAPEPAVDLADVRGQATARRALEIAAAGGHHILLIGPPGAGKTLLARALPSILPPLPPAESLEVTAIASCVGLLPPGSGLLVEPPFRAPHHNISAAGLIGGGGAVPRAGEITRAHRGVLFLDEVTEFRRDALEALRQPLEEGRVAVARVGGHAVFPGRFILVAAANPCACGFAGDAGRCRCTPLDRQRYQARLSGPIRDRIDLQVLVPRLPAAELLRPQSAAESTAAVRSRVLEARARQQAQRPTGPLNGALTGAQLRRDARLDDAGHALLEAAAERLHLTGRAIHRVLRVARTVADLEGAGDVASTHLAEALQYRDPA